MFHLLPWIGWVFILSPYVLLPLVAVSFVGERLRDRRRKAPANGALKDTAKQRDNGGQEDSLTEFALKDRTGREHIARRIRLPGHMRLSELLPFMQDVARDAYEWRSRLAAETQHG